MRATCPAHLFLLHRYQSKLLRTVTNAPRYVTNQTLHKGPSISGIKAFNHLPHYLKVLDHELPYFRTSLKRFFHHHSFYTIDQYFEYKDNIVRLN
jgi:hypothetical protein